MRKILSLTGNEAVGEAIRQLEPDVVAAYPITPQTELMERFAQYVADGKVQTEFVLVESEHSAMSASIGASLAGARSMTATSANGLALMWEVLYVASGNRCPIVMAVVSRALSGPINIHCDHSDSMGARDTGWIQLFSESAQEAYDNMIQATKISESQDVLLPTMVMLDGFITSHTADRVEVLDDAEVKKFVGEFRRKYSVIDVDNPATFGALDLQDYYFEHKRQVAEAVSQSTKRILSVSEEYGKLTGRKMALFESYRMDDAETGIIVLGSTAGTVKVVVDELRAEGKKVGMIKLRVFRPFPGDLLASSISHLKAVAVLDRSHTFGGPGGPVFTEVRASAYGKVRNVPIINYVYGLGGRDISIGDIKNVYKELEGIGKAGEPLTRFEFLGVRE
ncbi:MAG: pyruvate ferredoxin oxidoreductase [Candidatus Eisenbacteria bacterium]|nr:pyruvate ferredoxin oxidoreductase [Candidatus Eisenbacteria bacterium]